MTVRTSARGIALSISGTKLRGGVFHHFPMYPDSQLHHLQRDDVHSVPTNLP